jgi:chromosome segregation ATPase
MNNLLINKQMNEIGDDNLKITNTENIISKSIVIHKNKLDSIQTLFDKIQEKIKDLESDISRRLPSNEENQSNKNTWLKKQIEPLQKKLVNVKEKLNKLRELFNANKQKINSDLTEEVSRLNNINDSFNDQILIMKSNLENQKFEKEQELSKYRLRIKKIKECIEKKQYDVVLKTLNNI